MAEVAKVIYGHTAHVHADMSGFDGRKRLDGARQGVENSQTHESVDPGRRSAGMAHARWATVEPPDQIIWDKRTVDKGVQTEAAILATAGDRPGTLRYNVSV